MAATDFGQLSNARKKVWATALWITGRDQSFWMSNGFMGSGDEDMNAPIQRITQLTRTERGLECVMSLVQDMSSDGVAGDNMAEGAEEALVNEAITIRIDQLRNGVKSKGEMAEQATVIRFRAVAKAKLAFWLPDKIDEMLFLMAAGRAFTLNTNGTTRAASQLPQLSFANDVVAASTNRISFAGSATSEANVTANDKMSWNVIVNAKAKALRKRMRPLRERGQEIFAVVLTTEQCRDLELDPTYQTIVSRAGPRGSENPLFKNAKAMVSGIVIYEHNKVFNTLGLASGSKWGAAGLIDGGQALMFGAQALGFATIDGTFYRESDNTDYNNRAGILIGRKMGMLKPQWKSPVDSLTLEDFGILSIKTAAAATP